LLAHDGQQRAQGLAQALVVAGGASRAVNELPGARSVLVVMGAWLRKP
jgi:hypothetical protein